MGREISKLNDELVLLKLIEEYIACAKYSCKSLQDYYGTNETLLRAKVLKIIPRQGVVNGMEYYFHGRGCLFEYENDAIEVDFGPEGRCDGFDLYRLTFFWEHRKDRFEDLPNQKLIEEQFQRLISNGIIKKHPEEQEDHLYYLSKNLQ